LDNFFTLFLPFAQVEVFIPALFFIGFSVGLISSFLGIGGAWMVTPGLNILGFPMPYAIGTDIAHMAGKSILATWQHSKLKHVDYKLGSIMIFGTIFGIELGAKVVMFLEKNYAVDHIIRYVYLFLLFFLFIFIFLDVVKKKSSEKEKVNFSLLKKIQKLPLAPMMHFSVSGIYCSVWLPIIIGFFTGFISGFLGIGGGLVRLPALIYLIGCPVIIAIGTDLFEVMISGFYGALTYSVKGRVDFIAMMIMLTGAALGTRIGSRATLHVNDTRIKWLFLVALFGCFFAVLFKQLDYTYISTIFIFSTVSILTFFILGIFVFKSWKIKAIRRKTNETSR